MSTAFIRINAGAYRNNDVSGQVFQLVEQFKLTNKGGYVTVKNGNRFPGFPEDIRIKVDSMTAYEFVPDGEAAQFVDFSTVEQASTQTDEERMAEIAERFDILHEMTKAASAGDIRAMIVSGPPGVGKSFGVEQEIDKACLVDQIAGRRLRAEVVKGSASPLGLYMALYKYSDENCVLVTVKNGNRFPGFPEDIRIKVDSMTAYEFVPDGEAAQFVDFSTVEQASTQTDEERMAEIAERFDILHEMTKAASAGDIRAMIVSGPPGVGKSFGVEQEIDKACLVDQIAGRRLRAEVVKGSASPLGLYMALYKYSDENCVLVFDDCDTILFDDVSLNLLKGALDSGKSRRISWLSESRILKEEGIPSSFNFKGSVIFITNLKFDKMKSQKLKDHLDALQSRCHYLDLTLDTMRDKLLRIKQIARTGQLFEDLNIDEAGQDEIIAFMDANQSRLREMSLRMAIKIAQLYKSFPLKWQPLAISTCMKTA